MSKPKPTPPAAPPRGQRVRATELGFWRGQRIRAGATFTLAPGEKVAAWMEPVAATVPDQVAAKLAPKGSRRNPKTSADLTRPPDAPAGTPAPVAAPAADTDDVLG